MEMFYREKSGNEVNSLEMEKSEEIKERKEIIEKISILLNMLLSE